MSALISIKICGFYRPIRYYNIVNSYFLSISSYLTMKLTEKYESRNLRYFSIYLYLVSGIYGVIVVTLDYEKYKEGL